MNTIGKILVILNFLFAIIVGLLMVMTFATRNNWKDAYFELKKQTQTVADVGKSNVNAMTSVARDYQDEKAKNALLLQKIKDTETEYQAKLDVAAVEKDQLQTQVKDATTTNDQLLQTQKRHVFEIAHQNGIIKDRENAIVRYEADIKRYRTDAVQFESLAKTRQIQNENLLEQLRSTTQELVKYRAGVGGDGAVGGIREATGPNPPAVVVNGKIEKVDVDLVLISLGTDHGIAKGNTLDVYRTQPTPKYLGMVRIIDANHHQSVARLIQTGGNAAYRAKLQEGDLVTSKLLPK